MSKFYSINIQGDFVNFFYVEKKRSQYTVLEYDTIGIEDFSNFLKEKKHFYLSINVDEVIDDVITLPTSIKKDVVRRGLIYKKFKNNISTQQILLNYKEISKNIDDKTTTYKVDAISEVDYIEKLNYIDNWLDIKSTTINKFALLGLTRECYRVSDGFGYFSVYTQGNNIIVLAIDHNQNLLFTRSSTAVSESVETFQFTMIEEINKTIAYVKEHFRSLEFSTILLSGSMTLDDTIADNLFLSSNLPVSVLYPNTFINGIEQEEVQENILSIGAMLVKKEEQFIPDKILNLREYNFTLIALVVVSFLSLLITSTLMLQRYSAYSENLERYDNAKDKLIHMAREANVYSQKELERSYKHLQIAENFLQHSPSDYLIMLQPLLDMLHPKKYIFIDTKRDNMSVRVIFEKKFKTLRELYDFEKLFLEKFTLLNKEKKLHYINKTNYKSLKFNATIQNGVEKKSVITSHRRRRR